MNKKAAVIVMLIAMAQGAFAKDVPLNIKEGLYNLTNYWGKGSSALEYKRARKELLDELKKYDDWCTVKSDWVVCFLNYIKENASSGPAWIAASEEEISLASYAGTTRYSTNCWFIAAEYAKKLAALEKAAKIEFDKVWGTNCFDMSTEYAIVRNDAWTRWVTIEKALHQTMWATTNSFPRWILRKLPAEEGAMLYTNVLRRAGLVQ